MLVDSNIDYRLGARFMLSATIIAQECTSFTTLASPRSSFCFLFHEDLYPYTHISVTPNSSYLPSSYSHSFITSVYTNQNIMSGRRKGSTEFHLIKCLSDANSI